MSKSKKKKSTISSKVEILGTVYQIKIKNFIDDPLLTEDGAEGYCMPETKEIIVCDMTTYPGYPCNKTSAELLMKETLRHEILHAFLHESGLYSCSGSCSQWAMNEEMVDWFALQSPKIFKAYSEANIL